MAYLTQEQVEETERERKHWWLLDHMNIPVRRLGLRCTPTNPDYWFFPETGFSTHERSLYADKDKATKEAIHRQKIAISIAEDNLYKLFNGDY